MKNIVIRDAKVEDASRLLEIYTPYVEKTAITFEYDVPSLEDFENRIRTISSKYPYILVKKDGEILGYAYAGVYKGRAAYDWAVETTVYVEWDHQKEGLGRLLYDALEERLKKAHFLNMYACIAIPRTEKDPYCDNNSMDFHEHMGFVLNGTFHNCGYKFDTWYDMVWMEKMIGDHTVPPLPVIWGK